MDSTSMLNITEDTVWTNYEGRRTAFKDMDDEHLANIIKWVKERLDCYPVELLEKLQEFAEKRGLSEEFLAGAEYPFRNKDGELTINMAPLKLM